MDGGRRELFVLKKPIASFFVVKTMTPCDCFKQEAMPGNESILDPISRHRTWVNFRLPAIDHGDHAQVNKYCEFLAISTQHLLEFSLYRKDIEILLAIRMLSNFWQYQLLAMISSVNSQRFTIITIIAKALFIRARSGLKNHLKAVRRPSPSVQGKMSKDMRGYRKAMHTVLVQSKIIHPSRYSSKTSLLPWALSIQLQSPTNR
jgi:hypothetical protein